MTDFCTQIQKLHDAAPSEAVRQLLGVVLHLARCPVDPVVTPQSGGGTGGNPPTPPNNP